MAASGVIYHHFSDKNAVVVAVARQTIAGPLTALNAYRNRPASPAEAGVVRDDRTRDGPRTG